MAQLFSTNVFSANTFCLNILSTFTAIYLQSIVNTNNFSTGIYQRKQISRKWHRIYQDQTNRMRVIRLEVLGQNVLILNVLVVNSCAKNGIQYQHITKSSTFLWRVQKSGTSLFSVEKSCTYLGHERLLAAVTVVQYLPSILTYVQYQSSTYLCRARKSPDSSYNSRPSIGKASAWFHQAGKQLESYQKQ